MRKLKSFPFILILIVFCTLPAFASTGEPAESNVLHAMMQLMLQVGLLLCAARIGNILFEKLKLPGVLGELTAGLILGPHLLGSISIPGFSAGLFPSHGAMPVSPELYGLCTLASVVLLFMVGLETDLRLFLRYSLAGSLVGIGGVIVTFVMGDLMAVFFFNTLIGESVTFMDPRCIFLGIVSTPTSVGISARILADRKKIDSPEGVTILAGAVIDDVLGIILLAVGLGIVAATGVGGDGSVEWGKIGIVAARACGIWLGATVLGIMASRWLGSFLKIFSDRSAITTIALGLALILAGLFERAGLAMIIGGYVMGLSLSRTDVSHVIQEKLHPVSSILVPLFFAVMGMFVDLTVLGSTRILLFGIVYTIIADLAKIIGCGIPSLFCNFNMRGALRIGLGMLPRGEVTLIVAGTAMAAGVMTGELFGITVMMILLTSIIAPGALIYSLNSKKSGVRKKPVEDDTEEILFSFPSRETILLLITKLTSVFERDGFFVHTLDRRLRIYQLRKDAISINFRADGSELTFECYRRDVALINAAMVEVLAELEQTIRELRKPIDFKRIGRRISDNENLTKSTSVLAEYVNRSVLIPSLNAIDKMSVIDELLMALKSKGLLKDIETAKKSVLEREESMSTGMQNGVAIPHGRTTAVDSLVCAIGLKREGLDFDSIDGFPSRIFVLMLSPLNVNAPHVQFMSQISQILNKEGRALMLSCDTAEQMRDLLNNSTPVRNSPRRAIGKALRTISDMASGASSTEKGVARYLHRDRVILDLISDSREGVINELLQRLDSKGVLHDLDTVREDVFRREEEMPTGLGHGVAIPHARTESVDNLTCIVGILRKGVDFGAPDAIPARIVILTLTPVDKPAHHVQLMAMISRALDEKGREAVLAADTEDDVINILKR